MAAENGEEEVSDQQLTRLREAMRLPLQPEEGEKIGAAEKKCIECHDLDNSPEFNFEEYWPPMEHQGMD